jgi:hypothetical protein
MHRIGRVSLCLLAAVGLSATALAEDAATPQQQVALLLGQGLAHSHERLRAKYVFLPFALVLRKGGAIEQLGGHSGGELDAATAETLDVDPAQVLADLQQSVARESKTRGDVVAVGFFSDTEIKLPDARDSKAIEAELEHRSGLCQTVFEPYGFVDGQDLATAAQITTKRKGVVFGCK